MQSSWKAPGYRGWADGLLLFGVWSPFGGLGLGLADGLRTNHRGGRGAAGRLGRVEGVQD